ncbi:hypothetical protein BC937DRAFT_93392 [Endogone sp. FLAS-F59071]|nr:hypothetical protein BC937DRAFT_93392 [Endogone sp. FLAS-F59071]|eukprot:RUS14748.1 hypothetical protein BC937DRAFT_93392 [Endogone sp. FLAS-F59071]
MEPLRGAIASAGGIVRAAAGKVVKGCAWVTEREGGRLLGAGEGVFLEAVAKTDDDVTCQGKEKADNEHGIGMLVRSMCVIKQAFQQQANANGARSKEVNAMAECARGLETPNGVVPLAHVSGTIQATNESPVWSILYFFHGLVKPRVTAGAGRTLRTLYEEDAAKGFA